MLLILCKKLVYNVKQIKNNPRKDVWSVYGILNLVTVNNDGSNRDI